VTFHTRAGAEAAKQDLQVNFFFLNSSSFLLSKATTCSN
jgi:hypothetical protein